MASPQTSISPKMIAGLSAIALLAFLCYGAQADFPLSSLYSTATVPALQTGIQNRPGRTVVAGVPLAPHTQAPKKLNQAHQILRERQPVLPSYVPSALRPAVANTDADTSTKVTSTNSEVFFSPAWLLVLPAAIFGAAAAALRMQTRILTGEHTPLAMVAIDGEAGKIEGEEETGATDGEGEGVTDSEGEADATDEEPKPKAQKRRRSQTGIRLEDIEVGSTAQGKIRGIAGFGCFVDIGAARDGFVHISQVSNSFVENINDEVRVGQAVKVKVLKVDLEANKIELSMRQVKGQPKPPLEGYEERVDIGELAVDAPEPIRGKVLRLTNFGAFVDVNSEIDGLCHISELRDVVEHPEEVLKVGDYINVWVRDTDVQAGRIKLSMWSPQEHAEWEAEQDYGTEA